MQNNNGFEDMSAFLGSIHIDKELSDTTLKKGADSFAEWLRPNIPKGGNAWNTRRYGHMADQSQVVKTDAGYDVTFGDAFWWHFVENGTSGEHPQRAQNFVHGTFSQRWQELQHMLQEEAAQKLTK